MINSIASQTLTITSEGRENFSCLPSGSALLSLVPTLKSFPAFALRPQPLYNYNYNTKVLTSSGTITNSGTMANNIQQHALDLYPSPKDVPYPPATHLSALENGDLTLEDMMRKLDFAGGPVVREGDVLRVSGRILDLNGQFVHITKDVTVSQAYIQVERLRVLTVSRSAILATISR